MFMVIPQWRVTAQMPEEATRRFGARAAALRSSVYEVWRTERGKHRAGYEKVAFERTHPFAGMGQMMVSDD